MCGGARLAEAMAWLAEHAHENLGTELALRAVAAGADQWRVATAGPPGGLSGVAVWSPAGQWFLEADNEAAARHLATSVAQASEPRPTKVTTSGTVKRWLRPWLAEQGDAARIAREHDLWVMTCQTAPTGPEGRWATHTDREQLEHYQGAYNEERHTATVTDWDALVDRRAVAVLERSGRIVAVVKGTADAARYATIGGTWTEPQHRRYRSLGFEPTGRCHMAYLSDAR